MYLYAISKLQFKFVLTIPNKIIHCGNRYVISMIKKKGILEPMSYNIGKMKFNVKCHDTEVKNEKETINRYAGFAKQCIFTSLPQLYILISLI